MSALATAPEDNLVTRGAKLGTTSPTTVYANTATLYEGSPTASTKLDNCVICNTTGAAVTATVTWYDASLSTGYAIASVASVAANGWLAIDRVLVFQPGDELRVTAGTANALEVVVTTTTGRSRTARAI